MSNTEKRRDELAKEMFGHSGVGYSIMKSWEKKFIDKFIALETRLEKLQEVDPADELIVYRYCVVDRAGDFISQFTAQQEAIDFAASSTKDCQDGGVDWDYKVAAIVDQGGL